MPHVAGTRFIISSWVSFWVFHGSCWLQTKWACTHHHISWLHFEEILCSCERRTQCLVLRTWFCPGAHANYLHQINHLRISASSESRFLKSQLTTPVWLRTKKVKWSGQQACWEHFVLFYLKHFIFPSWSCILTTSFLFQHLILRRP